MMQGPKAVPPGDEGELMIGVGADVPKGVVVLTFGRPVSWVAMPPKEMRNLADLLVKRANDIDGKGVYAIRSVH